jgi:hypothetical protein
VPTDRGAGPFQPNGLAVCSRTTPRTGIAVRTGIIDPARPARKEPRQCHIGVVLTTAMPHRRGLAAPTAGAVVTGVAPGVADYTTVRVWDAVTGAPLGEPLAGHDGSVFAVAIGRAGDRDVIVSGSDDRTVLRRQHHLRR